MNKKNYFVAFIALTSIGFSSFLSYFTNQKCINILSEINIESMAKDEVGAGGSDCKWKHLDCPGLWTGDFEACVENGDGNSCRCGQTTRNC